MSDNWAGHLIILPILLPLVTGAILLFIREGRRVLKATISGASVVGLLVLTVLLLTLVDRPPAADQTAIGVYLLGNWAAPFGIVLVVDRLTALMLVLTAFMALPVLIFALGRWHRAGPHFHSLFQFMLMGINGSFLTGDLFNLFVFFEVMLAASYGLVLHGSGPRRVRAGMHYIVVNLVASFFILIGVSLIYGAAGTLSMADLAARVPGLLPEDRALMQAGAAILGVAFLVKAGTWPLNFWLPSAYAAASAPVAAMFAILTKVGVYVLLRLTLLVFGVDAGASSGFGNSWLLLGGLLTVVFGAIGVLATTSMGRLAGYSVIVSSGTVVAAVGTGHAGVAAGALFYLVASTLALCALFLLVELLERDQLWASSQEDEPEQVFTDVEEEEDEVQEDEIGVPVPATLAVLSVAFIVCTLMLAGLPPLPGFIAKFAILAAMLNPEGMGVGANPLPGTAVLTAILILAGLATLIAMMRAGIRRLWTPSEQIVPKVLVREVIPVAALLLACVVLSVQAHGVMRFLEDTTSSLHYADGYVRAVLDAPRAGRADTEQAP